MLFRSGRSLPPAQTSVTAPPVSAGPAAPAESSAPRLSIVVLPFTNLSDDKEQEYFADGVTDDLTTDLSRISGSFVIARNSAFTYKGKAVDVKQIGRELGVRYVLEGSVRRTGDQVRVNAQLIDAETGAHLWAERFERNRGELSVLQDEVTSRIARALNIELVGAEARRISAKRTENQDAADLAMRGWAIVFKPITRENTAAARTIFEDALRLDDRIPSALIGLAAMHARDALFRWDDETESHIRQGEQLIAKGLAIDPNNARAHFVRGQVLRAQDRKSTRLNSSHIQKSRMPSSA